jgi:hypothetical protein
MPVWVGGLFVGFVMIGLSERRSSRAAHYLAVLLIVIVLGYEAVKIRAF